MTANSNPLLSLLNVFHDLSDLNVTHPEWMHRFECADFCVDPLNELTLLLQDAPTPLARGVVAGKLSIAQSMASRTSSPGIDQRPGLRVIPQRGSAPKPESTAVSPPPRSRYVGG